MPHHAGRLLSVLLMALAMALPGGAQPGADPVANSFPPVIRGAVNGVAADAAGNKYVTGSFAGTGDFNPGVGKAFRTSAGATDCFVTRFHADGSHAWTQTFGGAQADVGNGIALHGSTVYVTGAFASSLAGIAGSQSLMNTGHTDAFVLALDAATGAPRPGFGDGGAQKFGGRYATNQGGGLDYGTAIVVTDSAVYVTGSFDSVNAGIGGMGSARRAGGYGWLDAFVIALDPTTGAAQTGFGVAGIQTFGGPSTGSVLEYQDTGLGIAAGPSTVYVTGYLRSEPAGVGGTAAISQVGQGEAYLLALDATTGQARTGFGTGGVQTFGGLNPDVGAAVAVSGSTVYMVGDHTSHNSGIGGPGPFAAVGAGGFGGARDPFVVAVDAATGAPRAGFGTGGVFCLATPVPDKATGVTIVGSTVLVSGFARYGGSGSVDPNFTTGNVDAFVLALDATTGTPVPGFGTAGYQSFGGPNGRDYGRGIAGSSTMVHLVGSLGSNAAGIGGTGTHDGAGFGGFLLDLSVKSGAAVQVATPGISPGTGLYTGSQNITLSCQTPGATIHFTTDGSTPTAASPAFTGPIPVAADTTIRAFATKPSMLDSLGNSANYRLALPADDRVRIRVPRPTILDGLRLPTGGQPRSEPAPSPLPEPRREDPDGKR